MPYHLLLLCWVKLRRCSVFIAAYLHLSNLVCHSSSLSLSLLALYASLRFLSLSSLSSPRFSLHLLSCGCWIVSNLCCELSVSWFTLRTIFSKLVIYTVILPWFCWTCMVFQLTLVFIHFLSYMVHPTKSLASVGLAQAHPNYTLTILQLCLTLTTCGMSVSRMILLVTCLLHTCTFEIFASNYNSIHKFNYIDLWLHVMCLSCWFWIFEGISKCQSWA